MIRYVESGDAAAVAAIYNYYVLGTVVTFEETEILPEEMNKRFNEAGSLSLPWYVFESNGRVHGYAYATKWKGRCSYRYSVETSVYVDAGSKYRGIGSMLYEKLLANLRQQNYHTAIGGIALPNPASVKLHERFGFEKVAHFKEVGFKLGGWVDVGYWQLVF